MLEEDVEVVYEYKNTWKDRKFRVVKAEAIDGIYYFPQVYERDTWGVPGWVTHNRISSLEDAILELGYTIGVYVMSGR